MNSFLSVEWPIESQTWSGFLNGRPFILFIREFHVEWVIAMVLLNTYLNEIKNFIKNFNYKHGLNERVFTVLHNSINIIKEIYRLEVRIRLTFIREILQDANSVTRY